MTDVYLRRTLAGHLAPADEDAATVLQRIKVGEVVRAEVRRPRNVAQHRAYWAMCSLVAINHEQLRTREQVHTVLKLLTDTVDIVAMKSTGEILRVPKSISFGSMSQTEFEDYFSRAKDAVVEHLLPGVGLQELQDEIMRIAA